MSRSAAQSSAQKAAAKTTRNLTPYTTSVVPPSVPPPVNRNPKRTLVLDLDISAVSPATSYNLTYAILRTLIEVQTGVPSNKVYFIVNHLHVWGDLTPDASSSISVTDLKYGTTMVGDNTVAVRSRAGLQWPKNAQFVIAPTDTSASVFAVFGAFVAPAQLTARIGVTYWGQGTALVKASTAHSNLACTLDAPATRAPPGVKRAPPA